MKNVIVLLLVLFGLLFTGCANEQSVKDEAAFKAKTLFRYCIEGEVVSVTVKAKHGDHYLVRVGCSYESPSTKHSQGVKIGKYYYLKCYKELYEVRCRKTG